MKCPKCGAESEGGSIFCGECGLRMDFTADQVTDALQSDLQVKESSAAEKAIRQFLVASIAIFYGSVLFRGAVDDQPRDEGIPFLDAPQLQLSRFDTLPVPQLSLDIPKVAVPKRSKLSEDQLEQELLNGLKKVTRSNARKITLKGPPQKVLEGCILKEWRDRRGRDKVTIRTFQPWATTDCSKGDIVKVE